MRHYKGTILALSAALLSLTSASGQLRVDPEILRDLSLSDPRLRDRLEGVVIDTGEHRWDFEDGTLQGFTVEDISGVSRRTSLHNQPTFGETVNSRRAIDTSGFNPGADPCAGLALDELTTCEYGRGAGFRYVSELRTYLDRVRSDLAGIGGDYHNVKFPIGKQGVYWIGTAENTPSTRQRRDFGVGGLRPEGGAAARGRIFSPTVELNANYLTMLVGGGCSNEVGVYLQGPATELRREPRDFTRDTLPGDTRPDFRPVTVWRTLADADGRPIAARGSCLENMTRFTFDIRHLAGATARVAIEDFATGAWGHVNVDDIRITNSPPSRSSRATDPVWGVADLHAHLMNEKSFTAFEPIGLTPTAKALWGSALGPIENLRACTQTHTTLGDSFTPFIDPIAGTHYTLCRDACVNLLEGAGLPEHPEDGLNQDGVLGGYHSTNGGFPAFREWPLWYSAVHQQMHWSWVRRAYQGGLRLMVASVGNSEVISFALVKELNHPFTSDQDAVALQIPAIKEFARQNAEWAEVAYTPRDARRIINAGKLAIVIGLELDHVMDSCGSNATRTAHHRATERAAVPFWLDQNGLPTSLASTLASFAQVAGAGVRVVHYPGHPESCTSPQIEERIDSLYREGVRQIIPMHFSDNMLGGYAVTGDLFVASAIFGDPRARPPEFMSQARLEERYGAAARPFEPARTEPTYGWNEARRREWLARRPIQNKLEEMSMPVWARLGPDTFLDPNVLPPDVSRNIAEFFLGRCISDDGWRIVAAFFSGGASEAACAATTITEESLEAARSTLPYEGALDSPAMIPLEVGGDREHPSFHVNARGLTDDGREFVRQMKRRGMTIDVQHASDLAKDEMLNETGSYPVVVSHGGVASASVRANENVVSAPQMRRIYDASPFAPGLLGIGVQSTSALVNQIDVASDPPRSGVQRPPRAVAIGTDINGIDWHAPPRFGQYGVYNSLPPDTPYERPRGAKVNYTPYAAGTSPHAVEGGRVAEHPPLTPLQIVDRSRVVRTFDINYDGLAHYGLLPDFFQELKVLGGDPAPLFNSSEAMIRVWEENCFLAYSAPAAERPRSLAMGCGPESNYR